MSSVSEIEQRVVRRDPVVGWGLLAGGALFFAGGSLHPKDDPDGVALKELLRVMFENPAWYPSHIVATAGMAVIAVALVVLARGRSLAGVPRAHRAVVGAALAAVAGAAGMVLHTVAALDADRIAAHHATPLVDVNLVVETVTVPAFGLAMAALAVIGAQTRTLGSWWSVPFAVVGGVGFALAGATVLFTDLFDPLFPLATGIAVWVMAAGAGAILPARSARVSRPSVPKE
jgi:hypothetical protein